MGKAMKATEHIQENAVSRPTFTNACIVSCRKLRAQIATAKRTILNEFQETLAAHDHLLRLALNEAEALAWQSGVPQLVFPTLAREKIQALASWDARQRFLQGHRPPLSIAA